MQFYATEWHAMKMITRLALSLFAAYGAFESVSLAARNDADALSGPVLEAPTLHSLGVHWVVAGDENGDAVVRVAWRARGGQWRSGAPLWRVERGAHKPAKGSGSVGVPANARLFAGSVLLLCPDTDHELKLTLVDPDGGGCETLLSARTLSEPAALRDALIFHVAPGKGGGRGSAADPFRGLAAAQAKGTPGTTFLLHAGTYPGLFTVRKSGEPGRPIVWRSAGDGAAILDGQGSADRRPNSVISANNTHDVWFEELTIRGAKWAFVAHEATRIVVRRCRISGADYGITATRNSGDSLGGWFVTDNTIEGPSTWPRSKGIENARGVQLSGRGHVIAYNRIRGFADGIDTFPSRRCAAIDIHNNDISECTDDGIELDYSERNVRCFRNRLTDVFQGISVQPVYGGPVYAFRNALYNVVQEPFKLHNGPSGALFFHNTCVKQGMPLILQTPEPVRHCVSRNNLFIGTAARYAYETTAPMRNCDFDYDGFGGGPWGLFMKWNGQRYKTLAEVRSRAPVYKHALRVSDGPAPPADPSKQHAPVDLRLSPGCAAIDAGEVLPGFNDGFADVAPDLGAFELDQPLPHYGPRPWNSPKQQEPK